MIRSYKTQTQDMEIRHNSDVQPVIQDTETQDMQESSSALDTDDMMLLSRRELTTPMIVSEPQVNKEKKKTTPEQVGKCK